MKFIWSLIDHWLGVLSINRPWFFICFLTKRVWIFFWSISMAVVIFVGNNNYRLYLGLVTTKVWDSTWGIKIRDRKVHNNNKWEWLKVCWYFEQGKVFYYVKTYQIKNYQNEFEAPVLSNFLLGVRVQEKYSDIKWF